MYQLYSHLQYKMLHW